MISLAQHKDLEQWETAGLALSKLQKFGGQQLQNALVNMLILVSSIKE